MKTAFLLALLIIGCDYTEHPDPVAQSIYSASITLGGVGCSMLRDAFDPGIKNNVPEYSAWQKKTSSGNKALVKYTGKGVEEWGTGNNHAYMGFNNGFLEWGASHILFITCINEDYIANGVDYYVDHMRFIEAEMQSRAPGVPVYVIGQAAYSEGICDIIGPIGAEFSQELADMAVDSTSMVDPGFRLPPITEAERKRPGDCHVNTLGAASQAYAIKAWLDSL